MNGRWKQLRIGEFFVSVSKKPFSARWQTVKKVPEAEQLAPVGVQRYGRARVATEVKILAEQAGLQQNCSLYVILRSEATKNPSLAKCEDPSLSLRMTIERNLDSVSDTLSCHSDFDGYGLF